MATTAAMDTLHGAAVTTRARTPPRTPLKTRALLAMVADGCHVAGVDAMMVRKMVAERVANPVVSAAMMVSEHLLTHSLGHRPGLTHELRLVATCCGHVLRLRGGTVGVPAAAGLPRGARAKAARLLRVGLVTAASGAAAVARGPRA